MSPREARDHFLIGFLSKGHPCFKFSPFSKNGINTMLFDEIEAKITFLRSNSPRPYICDVRCVCEKETGVISIFSVKPSYINHYYINHVAYSMLRIFVQKKFLEKLNDFEKSFLIQVFVSSGGRIMLRDIKHNYYKKFNLSSKNLCRSIDKYLDTVVEKLLIDMMTQ